MKGLLSLEYTRGVLDQQNRVKPLGTTLSTLAETMAQESAGCDFSLRSAGDSRQRAFQKGRRGRLEHRETIYGPDMDLVSRGVRPAIVLESRAGDKAYLKGRGIEERMEAAVR
jgi:hypothetical protein